MLDQGAVPHSPSATASQSGPRQDRPLDGVLLLVCLGLSGGAALMYELVWTRLLELTMGHTVYAFSAAVAAFMAGSAVGSRWLGTVADRMHPFRLLAGLELGIGVVAVLTPSLLEWVREPYLQVHGALAARPFLQVAIQFALAIVVLGLPTTLMGATLPAAVVGLVRAEWEPKVAVAKAYGINTLGAAAGVGTAGLLLLPWLGGEATLWCAAGLNFSAALGVALLSTRAAPPAPPSSALSASHLRHTVPHPPSLWLLAGVSATGAIGMMYQILWVRALVLVVGGSIYAVTMILLVFISGIALGSLLFWRVGIRPTLFSFGALNAGVGCLAVLLVPYFDLLPRFFLWVFQTGDPSVARIIAAQLAVILPVVLLPTTLMGAILPCAVALGVKGVHGVGRGVGLILSWNTAGAILGVAAVAVFLIPQIGARSVLIGCVSGNFVIALFALWGARPQWRTRLVAAATCVFLALLGLPSWDPRVMSLGVAVHPEVFDQKTVGESIESYFKQIHQVQFYREGPSATVAVLEGQGGIRALLINGKADAGNSLDMMTQVRLASVPLVIHPQPVDVAVIGLGSGVTTGIAAANPATSRVDVVELEPSVVEAAGLFTDVNDNCLANEKVHVFVDDARTFFSASSAVYDVIISEPSSPWMAGEGDLFSTEFYRLIESRLKPGGVLCQWLQAYDIRSGEFRMVLRGFMDVFPDTTLWVAGTAEHLVIGRKQGPKIDLTSLLDRMGRHAEWHSRTAYYSNEPLTDLLLGFLADPDQVSAFAGLGERNTDDRPLLQYLAPWSMYRRQSHDLDRQIRDLRTRVAPHFLTDERIQGAQGTLYMVARLLELGRNDESLRLMEPVPARDPMRPEAVPNVADRVVEGLEGPPAFVFAPFIHIPRTEDGGSALPIDSAGALEWFRRVSGVYENVGRQGSRGLLLEPAPWRASAGYFAAFVVEPGGRYRLSFWSRTEAMSRARAGVGRVDLQGLDAIGSLASGTLPPEWVAGVDSRGLVVRQSREWAEHTYEFQTATNAGATAIVLFVEGSGGRVVFDDLTLSRVL